MSTTPVFVEPFDPAQPRGTPGHRRKMLRIHQAELDALRRVVAVASGPDVWLSRALPFRLESRNERDLEAIERDEAQELARLRALA